jgi:PAS domain S-box-containing protein
MFRALHDAAVEGIVTIDGAGIVQSVNPAVERLFGYRAEEVVGDNVSKLMPSPYREEHDGYVSRYCETGEARIIGIGREVVAQCKDGRTFPIELTVAEVEHDDGRLFMGTIRDVSARRQAQEALRREQAFVEQIVATAGAVVLVLDPRGRVVRFNPFLTEIAGHSLEEVEGEDWFATCLPARVREPTRAVFARALAGEAIEGSVHPILSRDGREIEIEWHAVALRAAGGAVSGILAIGHDVTDRKRLQEQLLQAQKMEAVGRLAGGVAHDFNTLLGTVLGYGERLRDRLAGQEPLRRQAEQILRAAGRGAELTKQLLAFSRRTPPAEQVLDLRSALADVEEMLQRLIGEDIEMVFELDRGLWRVRADPSRIEQVVVNLAVNAADAMPRGGRMTVALSNLEIGKAACAGERGRWVLLAVTDTGIGMDEATRLRIFEPFFTTKPVGEGTGLGLSTVYGIVAQSGGRVTVDSEPGRGSRFEVRLPAVDGPRPKTPPSGPEERARGGTETVLVAEDDDLFRGLIREMLEDAGYAVVSSADPAAALEAAAGHAAAVDLLLSDMVMPGGTGSELAQRLKGRYPALRVVLMSGYTDDDLARRDADGDAADAFIAKPFSVGALLRLVRTVLDDRSSS